MNVTNSEVINDNQTPVIPKIVDRITAHSIIAIAPLKIEPTNAIIPLLVAAK